MGYETQQQKDLEDSFYEALKDSSFAQDALKLYPQEMLELYPAQTIEELARVLTEGLGQSWVGKIIRKQDKTVPLFEWEVMCKAAFKNAVIRLLEQAADQTKVELMKLKATAESAEYHTGEITGPGVLMCDKCGENLHFHDAGHIPPCPKCHDTHFHRLFCQ